MAGAAAFASAALERAIGTLSLLLPGFFPSARHGEEDAEELGRLVRTMRRIRAAIDDGFPSRAPGSASASARLRLRELRGLAYDAEDVVSECEYEAVRRRAEALDAVGRAGSDGGRCRLKRVRREVIDDYFSDIDMVPVVHDLAPAVRDLAARARKIRVRLDEIIKEYEDLCMTDNDGEQQIDLATQRSQRYTSSIVHEPSIHGREVDKNNIIKMLLSEVRPMSVLAIVGMGGLGKTTLAQLVFNDQRVRQSFDRLAWICVSDQFDLKIITRNIISSLQKQKYEALELNDLQEALIEQIERKKLLIVLDDVWNEHRAPWDSFCAPMMTTELCTIIVTTRSKTVASLVQTMPSYSLNCLTSAASWSLFEQITFEGLLLLMQISYRSVRRLWRSAKVCHLQSRPWEACCVMRLTRRDGNMSWRVICGTWIHNRMTLSQHWN